MDWYEALNAWQRRQIDADEAIRICEVTDIWELWELALGGGIDIKLGDRDHIAGVIRGKRQIERGEWEDMDDVIADMDRIIAGLDDDRP